MSFQALVTPAVSAAEAGEVASSVFGVQGPATVLGSSQEANFRVGGHVLKVAHPSFPAAELDLQNAAMQHVAGGGVRAPTPQPSLRGRLVERVELDAGPHLVRLLTFMDGELFSDADYLCDAALQAFGALVARIGLALADFDHPAADRVLQWDARRGAEVVAALSGTLPRPRRDEVTGLSGAAWAVVGPLSADLRQQVIHADVADYNVIATRDPAGRLMPSGVIDFGDVLRSWLVGDLAAAIATILSREHRDPLADACAVARGFHGVRPLTEPEAAALWPLIVARAAVLVASLEDQLAHDPANDYLRAEGAHDWRILARAGGVPFPLAAAAIRQALDLPATTCAWTGARIVAARPAPIDLSVRSAVLDGGAWLDPSASLAAVRAAVARAGGVAAGGHGEARLTRSRPDQAGEPETVHLGVDVFCAVGTPVRAPAAGSVLSAGARDLVLACGEVDVRLGGVVPAAPADQPVEAGDVVAHVAETADGVPHVHVQLVAVPGLDAPSWTTPTRAPAWLELCPDPGPLAGLAPAAPSRPGDVVRRRHQVLADVQEHYYVDPPQIERGWRHHLYDTMGRAYLDVVNNVAVLGHSHPAVTAAADAQLRLLNTNSRFVYEAMTAYAERIVALLPGALDTVLLVNSGSEAIELALRLARAATGRRDVVCLAGGYHGWTTGADAISTTLNDNPQALETRPDWVHLAPLPDTYRGAHRGADADARYADAVRDVVRAVPGGPAAFIAEPLLGNAGGVELPDGYLPAVYATVRAAGGLCISDEVQIGYGRVGSHFWGFEMHGVVPDILTMAKAAGNGHPVGFVVTRRAIAQSLASEGSLFASTGGAPVSCAVGIAVLDALVADRLQENAAAVGAHLRARLETLAAKHPLIGRVHGRGLYLGVELVVDRETREPATQQALAICERLRELGVIVQPTGDHSNVLKVKPPLCIATASADVLVDRLDQALTTGW